MVAAINRTLKDEMARNPRIVVFGEDVADASKSTLAAACARQGRRLQGDPRSAAPVRLGPRVQFAAGRSQHHRARRRHGHARAEAGGRDPVLRLHLAGDDAARDEMSMLRYRSSNNFSCPMVVRVPIGGYLRGGAPYHSQSGVSIFAHCPGIRIVFPSNAVDAAGLLRTSIRCDDPVLFLEHKHLYRQTYNKGVYPGADYMIPFGKGSLRREGTDIVVLTWGALVQRSLLAAQQAEKDGISVAVFDLRTIMPYDWDGIADLVKKTNRVIVAHEDQLTCGFGAEIAARISDELFDYLDAPDQARRRDGLPRRLLPRSRRSDPAAVGRRAAGDPRASRSTEQRAERRTKNGQRLSCLFGSGRSRSSFSFFAFFVRPFFVLPGARPAPARSKRCAPSAAFRPKSATSSASRWRSNRQPPASITSSIGAGMRSTASTPDAHGVRKVVEIGGERGRVLEPTAFDVAPNGTFAVADAPQRPRAAAGFRFRRQLGDRLHAAGPRRDARQHQRPGAGRRQHAGVSRRRHRPQSAGNRRADHRIRIGRHAGAQHRHACARPGTKRSAAASRHEHRRSRAALRTAVITSCSLRARRCSDDTTPRAVCCSSA